MPHADIHKTKQKKNLAVFGIVITLMALIWAVTMIKIAGGVPQTPPTPIEESTAQ